VGRKGRRRRGGGGGGGRANAGRVAAARALLRVEEGAHLEEALGGLLPDDPRDRTLAWFLAFGVLRRRGHVDGALRARLKQPLPSLDLEVQVVLRLGAFEKLFGRAAEHAVVHQWVEASRALGAGRASGLVNAVLRRVRPGDLTEAEALDHPAWLVSRWVERYGEGPARAWMESNASPPPLFVVAPGGLPDELKGEPARAHGVGEGVYRVEADGPVPDLPGFASGRFWVQDLAAVAVADQVPVVAGARVLDACAAPGGKSFRLASRGADVLAVDRSEDRLQRVQEGASRLGLSVACRVHDWSQGPMEGLQPFDAVVVDAPCSGLGTVRRHPEIRWRRHPLDLAAAAERQAQILASAAGHVAPGGTLVYAVCSPEPEEGREVVDAFLADHPAFAERSTLHTAPPSAGEDAHAAFVLTRRS